MNSVEYGVRMGALIVSARAVRGWVETRDLEKLQAYLASNGDTSPSVLVSLIGSVDKQRDLVDAFLLFRRALDRLSEKPAPPLPNRGRNRERRS